jgi:hypothetical protein
MSQIVLQPVQRVCQEENDNDQVGSESASFVANLSPHPRDLFQLWHKYEFGIDGRNL